MTMKSSTSTSVIGDLLEPKSRAALRLARRVVIKAGTSVVANSDGSPSLTRLGAIVEQIAELNNAGVEVILVSSGAVGMGRNLLRKQARLTMSFMDLQMQEGDSNGNYDSNGAQVQLFEEGLSPTSTISNLLQAHEQMETSAAKSCAAAGQFEMMSLYQSLFSPKNVTASQMLLTQPDFGDSVHMKNLSCAVDRLLKVGIVPIINENDAVSEIDHDNNTTFFSDNDSLAALCARYFNAEVLVLLTDVEGVYNKPPSDPKAKLLPFYHPDSNVQIGTKSNLGRGGMAAKINAAQMAVRPGSCCTACVVASGSDLNCIRSLLSRAYDHSEPPKGTLFATPGSDFEKQAINELASTEDDGSSIGDKVREIAEHAKHEGERLQSLPFEVRQAILHAVADALLSHQEELLAANKLDLDTAIAKNMAQPLVERLRLTEEKIAKIVKGIHQLAQKDPLGVVKSKRELAKGLELSQVTVAIGTIMVIFEARPDSFPEIVSLALATANGLLIKGGKEAIHSNTALNEIIGDAIEKGSSGKISRDIIGHLTSRGQVGELLKLDDTIDLVVPRGSRSLISFIKKNTTIPTLDLADGICHVYVDSTADPEDAIKVAVDAKTDMASASNAMETLLLHRDTFKNGVAFKILMALRSKTGIKCLGGPKAMVAGLCDLPAKDNRTEYGDWSCTIEIVESVDEAIQWIRENGTGHTDAIVCSDDSPAGDEFLKRVNSACVFKNVSTRFTDGYRFGLGGEVGISTGRIHSRGPVDAEGLTTTKWVMCSSGKATATSDFVGDKATRALAWKEIS